MTGAEHYAEAERLVNGDAQDQQAALVHATLALAARDDVATCPHGTTGLCMYCVRDWGLLGGTS